MKQKEIVLEFLKEHKYIIPAKLGGRIYKDTMFGSELPRVCRQLWQDGILERERIPDEPKFKRFYLKRSNHTTQPLKDNYSPQMQQIKALQEQDRLQPILSL